MQNSTVRPACREDESEYVTISGLCADAIALLVLAAPLYLLARLAGVVQ